MLPMLVTTRIWCTDVFKAIAGAVSAALLVSLSGCGASEEDYSGLESLDDTFAQFEVYGPESIYVNAAIRDQVAEKYHSIPEAWQPSWSEASRDPGLWRSLHRRERFDTVVLGGPPNDYHQLATHLMGSPDWRLAWLDNTALVFRNDGLADWSPGPAATTGENFEDAGQRAAFLAQMAGKLSIAGMHGEAEDFLAEAKRVDGRNSSVRAIAALIALRNGQIDVAEEEAEAAVSINRSNPLALQMLTEVEIRLGKGDDALEHAEEFDREHGRSINSLYQLVRAANAAKFPAREAEYLEELISQAEARQLSTSVLRVFLGQAYARQSMPERAVEQFKVALESEDLTRQQRLDIEDALMRVQSNSGVEE